MSDREPEAIDTLHALIADSTIAEAEAYWRADERRKVIAELKAEQVNGEESEIVYGVMEVIAAEYGASDNATAHAVLDRVASLLAPEGGYDKDVPADSGADKSAISASAPSPEQARESDRAARVLADAFDYEYVFDYEPGDELETNYTADYWRDLAARVVAAHEEGSTNG